MFFVTQSLVEKTCCEEMLDWFRGQFTEGISAEHLNRVLSSEGRKDWLVELLALDPDLTRELLDLGVSPNIEASSGHNPLFCAVASDRKGVCDVLIQAGARVGIHEATALGMEDALKAILHETPASVSLADPDGYTALHWAVRFRQEGCIRLLLAAKADVNARTSPDQETPLHIGSWYDWEHGIRLLLAAGAEVNARSSVGLSPLDIAAIGDNTSVMKLLITAGAQVDDRNDLGETALHQAAGSGALNAVELLLDSGAFVNARSKAGRTPLKEASDPQGSFQEVAYRMGEQEMYWVPIEKGPEDLPALLRFLHARDEGETTLAEVVALLRKCGGSE